MRNNHDPPSFEHDTMEVFFTTLAMRGKQCDRAAKKTLLCRSPSTDDLAFAVLAYRVGAPQSG